jgi:beta-glucanase (GH16 family)
MKRNLAIAMLLVLQTTLLFSCKEEENTPPVVPTILINGITVKEGNSGEKAAIISVDLSEITTVPVTFSWHTEDGSAKAGDDYTAVENGTITIDAGEVSRIIEVPLVTDGNLEFDETFKVVITNIQNATAPISQVTVIIENDDSYTAELVADGYITPATYEGMTLVWGDEFDGTSLNTADWNYEQGGGGWGNNELQVYTNGTENSFVQDGFLTIKAVKNPYTSQYTSARLTTKGKQEFKYGRIDIRAKMPIGQGIWPALWMLGANISNVGWPGCGEIDIMEYLGHEPFKVYGTVHYSQSGHQYKGDNYTLTTAENFHDKFHVFTIIWQENSIQWYMDYHKYFTATPATINYSAFNLPQFFIFNVAVGGNWPGNPNSSTVFPQSMIVDYVRVFQ